MPRNIRIRYVLLKSIGQFVAPVRVSLTLISQNAGIYSVLLSSISWFGWSAGSKKAFFFPGRLRKNTGRVFEGFCLAFFEAEIFEFFTVVWVVGWFEKVFLARRRLNTVFSHGKVTLGSRNLGFGASRWINHCKNRGF